MHDNVVLCDPKNGEKPFDADERMVEQLYLFRFIEFINETIL